jgi:hypothetical protein
MLERSNFARQAIWVQELLAINPQYPSVRRLLLMEGPVGVGKAWFALEVARGVLSARFELVRMTSVSAELSLSGPRRRRTREPLV